MKQDEAAKDASVRGSRQDRLKLALRENLRRRKGQVRARSGASDASASQNEGLNPDRPDDQAKPET